MTNMTSNYKMEEKYQEKPRVFSHEQQAQIDAFHEKCAKAECDEKHNCNIDPCANCGSYKVEEREYYDPGAPEVGTYRYCNNCGCNADIV